MQAVLLYRSNSWVITDKMMKVLELFYHHIARRIMGKMDRRVEEEGLEFPPSESDIEAAFMWPMR